MSYCPSVRCRNVGSGYVKPSESCAESNKKLDELLAARAAQDNTYFPPIINSTKPTTHQSNVGNTAIPQTKK
jgi:hypothetical protein